MPDIPKDSFSRSLQSQANNKFSSQQKTVEHDNLDIREELDEVVEEEADALLKWAKDLPEVSGDKEFKASGSSFFKKGIC